MHEIQSSELQWCVKVDAGMEEELVLGDPTAPRFVLWGGELLPTPSGPDVVTFKLLSLWGKIRAGMGAVGIKKPLPGTFAPAFRRSPYQHDPFGFFWGLRNYAWQ